MSELLFRAWSVFAWLIYIVGSAWRILAGRPRNTGPIDRERVRSIALIRVDEMGDFVIFSAILRPLRQAFPEAHITLVVCDWICDLAALCPYVDEVVPFPSGGSKWRQLVLGPLRALRVARRLGREFDLVINPRSDRDVRGAGFLAHFCLAPWLIGYSSGIEPFKARLNRGYDRFYTHLLPVPGGVCHEIERSRGILKFLGIPDDRTMPQLWLSIDDHRRAAELLVEQGWRPGDPLLAIGINASYARKRWPIERYMQLADRLRPLTERQPAAPGAHSPRRGSEREGIAVDAGCGADLSFLIVGGKADRATAELLRPVLGERLINLAGRAGLRVSAAALDRCCLYVGNDSGPKHMAAALGKPVVEITCHPRDGDRTHFQAPERFGALSEWKTAAAPRTARKPCRQSCLSDKPHCIMQVSVDEVVESVVSFLVSAAVHE